VPKLKHLFIFQGLLIVLAFFYYSFFVNKGLVFFDEGYYLHASERILNGQIPYKDFFLQYGPTYFYLLAILFKVFGPLVIVGRFLNLLICLLIPTVMFVILNQLKIKSYLTISLTFLVLIFFGFPLVNLPNLVWANVLSALLLLLIFIVWNRNKDYRLAILMGLLFALSVSFKQNLGLAFIVLFSVLIIFAVKNKKEMLKNLLLMTMAWILPVFAGAYYFFLRDNLQGFYYFLNFSRRFAQESAFSYPSLTMLFQPLGIFKLLPYYLPVILLVSLLIYSLRKTRDLNIVAFMSVAVIGFFVSIYPQSDLLHCYPFLGLVLVSFLLFPLKNGARLLVLGIVFVTILTGFYLTFFTKSYRYESLYFQYNTSLNLPRTQGVLVTPSMAKSVTELNRFIQSKTSKDDYILAYPYSPMLYFILERQNPSKDLLYFLPAWHFYSDKAILSEMKDRKVKYIITNGDYKYDSNLSRFIQQQKEVFADAQFAVFEVGHY
jgi:hypothetical protein